jgi:hypothetical protein
VPVGWTAHYVGFHTPLGGLGTTSFDMTMTGGPGSCSAFNVSVVSLECQTDSTSTNSGTLTGPFSDCSGNTYGQAEPALGGLNDFTDFLTAPDGAFINGQVGEVDTVTATYTTNCPDGHQVSNTLSAGFITSPLDCTPFTLTRAAPTASGSCAGNAGGSYSLSFTITVTYGLLANAGGTYTTSRTELTTLDGSKSIPGPFPITKYAWTWSPGADCGGITLASQLASPGETGESVTIVPLCSLSITLTVTDSSGATSSDSTTLTVTPRGGTFGSTANDSAWTRAATTR